MPSTQSCFTLSRDLFWQINPNYSLAIECHNSMGLTWRQNFPGLFTVLFRRIWRDTWQVTSKGTLNCHHIWQVEVHCFFLSFSSSEIIRNQLSFSFDFYRSTVDELKAPVFQNLVRLLCNLQKQQQVPLNHWSRHASVASRLWHACEVRTFRDGQRCEV